MPLVVEDGSAVAGANALASPQYVAGFHADRGIDLVLGSVLHSTTLTFSAAGTVTGAPLSSAAVPPGSIVQFLGAAEDANSGFAYVDAVSGSVATLAWLTPVDEAEGASVTIRVFLKTGWTGKRARLEGTILNATQFLSTFVIWYGLPLHLTQGTPWPRRFLFTGAGSPYYDSGVQIPTDVVPDPVRMAVAMLTAEDLRKPVLATVDPQRQLKSKTVGPISKTFDNPRGLRKYPDIERVLRGLYAPRGRSRQITRV